MQKKITLQALKASLLFICLFTFITSNAQVPCTTTSVAAIAPATGPAGTVVTLTGLGFTTGAGTTSVKFNGVEAASFTVVSDTQITAAVPTAGTSGAITIITNGCQATGTAFTYLQSSCVTTQPEIYISELYDHVPGSYGVIELYNPSPTNTVTFNGEYVLERYGDVGGTLSYTLTLPGSIGPEETYLVLSYGTGVMGCSVVTDATMGTGINESDQFLLRKNGAVIDESRAPNETGYSVIRKPNAVAPNTTYAAGDWNFFSTQSCDDLGSHTADPAPAAVNITTQPADQNICLGQNATFTVTLNNTTGATYQWKTLVAGAWVNVTGGNYSGATTATLTITGATLLQNNAQYYCEITLPTCNIVSEAAQLTVSPLPEATLLVVNTSCLVSTGTITVVPGTGLSLTYSINGGAYVTNPVFSSLAPGSYTITVQNAAGCTLTLAAVTINTPLSGPDVATTDVTHPTCTTTTGTITVTAPLGTDYTYTLNSGTPQQSPVFSGLAPGNYTITVTNALGCTSVTPTITVNPVPNAPDVAVTTVTQPDCTTPTGTITISELTGIGYAYSINGGPFQSATVFAGLLPGDYTITTQNAAGCTSVTPIITINPAPGAPDVATTTEVQPGCTVATGSITVTAPVGTEYQYSLNGGTYQSAVLFYDLAPGSYTLTVQNATGCTSATAPIVINAAPTAPAIATTTQVQPTCTNPVASITVTAPLGSEYQYSLNGGAYQSAVLFDNLAAGSYTITVQNADGCTSVSAPITINPALNAPDMATTTVTQPDCIVTTGTITVTAPVGNEYTYSLDGGLFQTTTAFTGIAPGSHTITVQNTDGCTSVTTVTVNPVPGAPATPTLVTTDPTCGNSGGSITVTAPLGTEYTYSIDGINFQAGTAFTGLASGNYTVTVQAAAGCISTTSATINTGNTPPAIATITAVQPTCATAQGSLTVTSPLGAEYSYSINGGAYQASPVFTDLQSGSYSITVQITGGCTSTAPAVIIENPSDLPVITGTQGCESTINGRNYFINASPENNSFNPLAVTYEWRVSGSPVIVSTDASFNVTQYAAAYNVSFPTVFEVTVTTPGGCEAALDYTVDGIFCDIPRGISPNNDTMNDSFDLTGMNVRNLQIFNRYGLEVYSRANYSNQWSGQTNSGDDLPTGTYFYVIDVAEGAKTGWIYINRQDN